MTVYALKTEQRGLLLCLLRREPCRNGWTDRDAILDLDSGGLKNHAGLLRGPLMSAREGPMLKAKRGRPRICRDMTNILKAIQQRHHGYDADAIGVY